MWFGTVGRLMVEISHRTGLPLPGGYALAVESLAISTKARWDRLTLWRRALSLEPQIIEFDLIMGF